VDLRNGPFLKVLAFARGSTLLGLTFRADPDSPSARFYSFGFAGTNAA